MLEIIGHFFVSLEFTTARIYIEIQTTYNNI